MTAAYIEADKASTSMLDELNSGFLDGYTYGDVKSLYPEEYAQRKKDKLRYRYPGGKTKMTSSMLSCHIPFTNAFSICGECLFWSTNINDLCKVDDEHLT